MVVSIGKVVFLIDKRTERDCEDRRCAKSSYLEWIWREHGGPAQAIRQCEHQGIPATLEEILRISEEYDRQEHEDDIRFFNGRYIYEKVLLDLAEMIKTGWIYMKVMDEQGNEKIEVVELHDEGRRKPDPPKNVVIRNNETKPRQVS